MKHFIVRTESTTAEAIVHIIDKTYRHFFCTYGVRRLKTTKKGIMFEMDALAWDYIYRVTMEYVATKIEPDLCWNDRPDLCEMWTEG